MQKIIPCLWFDKECEEAVNFYIDTFNNAPNKKGESRIVSLLRYPQEFQVGPVPDMQGKVWTVVFELAGQRFMALDGGPYFKFTEAISLNVDCEDQEEIDYYWEKLSAVPEAEQCGWLKDKYGVSWQIVPKVMNELLLDPDPQKVRRVTEAFLPMKKLDIQQLLVAAEGN